MDIEKVTHELVDKEKYIEAFSIREKLAELGEVISISNLGWHYYR